MTDQEIIDGFLSGTKQAHSMVLEWTNAVVRYVAHHERLSPDDLVGDTVEKLLRLFRDGAFKGESTLKTYVQRITKYTIIDAARRPAVVKTGSLPDTLDVPDGSDPFTLAVGEDEKTIYQRMLERISRGCRELWKKIFVENLPYKEIALQLGISEGAVKVRVFRCKDDAVKIVESMR